MDELIMEYVHLTFLVEYAKKDLESIAESNGTQKALQLKMCKVLGAHFRDQLQEVSRKLRSNGVYVRIENSGESVFVHSTSRGQKDRIEINRRILQKQVEDRLEKMAENMLNMPIDSHYKAEMHHGDPYVRK